jgi:hypothetical protein
MKTKRIIESITALLICLFIYASISKLLVFDEFKWQLFNQPIPGWSASILVWLLPVSELTVAGLLLNATTRLLGLYGSLLLMIIFTTYVGLVLADSFGRIPCSCGGILKKMGWGTHLIFNIFFVLLSLIGIVLYKKKMAFNKIKST